MNDQEIEQAIRALTAPRVTMADIEAAIADEHYFTAEQGAFAAHVDDVVRSGRIVTIEDVKDDPANERKALGLLTICVLVLRNGFTVTGESACACTENFDAKLGRKIARQHAVSKIWPLMGYELRSRLAGAVEVHGTIETKTYVIGVESRPDMDDAEKGRKLLGLVNAFVSKHAITCQETIFRVDAVAIDASMLAADLVEVAGYNPPSPV